MNDAQTIALSLTTFTVITIEQHNVLITFHEFLSQGTRQTIGSQDYITVIPRPTHTQKSGHQICAQALQDHSGGDHEKNQSPQLIAAA
jgi:hypothetical protein